MTNPDENKTGEEEVKEAPMVQQENVPTPIPEAAVEQVAADPFAKGRERMAAASGFFTKAKEKFIATKNMVGASMSRFWSRTKTMAGTATAAVLSADVLAKRADNWVGDKVEQAGAGITKAVLEEAELFGDSLEMGYDWTQKKANELQDFIESKADQMTKFVDDKVELAKDVAFYVKMKTNEGLDKAKNSIKNRWGKIKAFGENAIESGKLQVARMKEGYRAKMNAVRESRLLAEYEAAVAAESDASERAQQLKKRREELGQKMGLLRGLSVEAAAA